MDSTILFGFLLIINGLLVAVAVVVHYETLYQLARTLPHLRSVLPRYRVLLGVFIILTAHAVEIWLFAIGYYGMLQIEGMGTMSGQISGHGSLMDCVYHSFVTFSTVGSVDVIMNGNLRYLTGMEALTGFVLITWSASFLFLEMQKYWPSTKSHS